LTKAEIRGNVRDSSYGAIYYPWVQVFDPVKARDEDPDPRDFLPPSGYVAGVYARVDAQRGVHKAPANEVIRGALDVETPIGKAEQAGLNPEDINVIRRFDGNVTIWGAHTMAGKNTEWKYVNIRRLFLFIRESIDEGTQWVVFEPNDRTLWAKIVRTITAFLTNVWRDGALFGSKPEEAFYVRCDDSNNPPEVRDLGRVVIEIGVAVVKPAEFVIIRISQMAAPAK
jgi:phage tail sheath protein FI